MQFSSPVPAVAVEGDPNHVDLHNDSRSLLEEMSEADLQSDAEVRERFRSGWVYRVMWSGTTYAPRNPEAKYHDYVGPNQPTGMVPGDTWTDTSAG